MGWDCCNARHKDFKNKRILPQKLSKITNFISIRYQTYFRRQSNRHTNLSIIFSYIACFCVGHKKETRTYKKNLRQRLIATPAIRTLKISTFYLKNGQNISLLVVDILQPTHTVTQTSHIFFRRSVVLLKIKQQNVWKKSHGRVPALQRPP